MGFATSWKHSSEEVMEKLNEASIIMSTGVTGFSVVGLVKDGGSELA